MKLLTEPFHLWISAIEALFRTGQIGGWLLALLVIIAGPLLALWLLAMLFALLRTLREAFLPAVERHNRQSRRRDLYEKNKRDRLARIAIPPIGEGGVLWGASIEESGISQRTVVVFEARIEIRSEYRDAKQIPMSDVTSCFANGTSVDVATRKEKHTLKFPNRPGDAAAMAALITRIIDPLQAKGQVDQ